MKIKLLLSLFLLTMLFTTAFGQSNDFPMNDLLPSDWNIQNWDKAAEVAIHPTTKKVNIKPGNQLIYSEKSGAMASSKATFGEFKLKFELLQSADAASTLILQNAYVIQLNASFGSKGVNFGSIINNDGSYTATSQDVVKAPGLWNTVELSFIPSQNGRAARLENLLINGVNVQQNVFLFQASKGLELPTESKSAISFVNQKGTTALRNISFLNYEQIKPIKISNLKYTLQETESDDPNFTATAASAKTGSLNELSYDVPNDYTRYRITFEGDLEVEESNKYAFTAVYQGQGYLYIDDELVAGGRFSTVRGPQKGLIDLNKGTHKFKFVYQRVWWSPALGLFVSSGQFRPYPLHARRSLPEAKQVGGIFENPQSGNPQILRSFMMHNGKKLTEVLSVGDPNGVHYSFDLGTGSLLAAWRGSFADVTEMWHERGEPQLIQPLGMTKVFSGGVSDFDAYMSEMDFNSYILDENGVPTFYFKLGDTKISKSFRPENDALVTSIGIKSDNATDHILAQGKQIISLGEGVFKVDETFITLNKNMKVEVVEVDDSTNQLISHLPAGKHAFTYKITW